MPLNKETNQLLIQYLNTNQIHLTDPKNTLKLFFLPFFQKSSNLILIFFIITVFDLIRQFVQKIHFSIRENIQMVGRLSFSNLS